MIVESPNKIKAILGSGWDVAASVGHIRDLPAKSLGIEPNTYRLEYQILERSESVVAQLRQRAARSEQVYLATDPDREGEAIAWHLQQVLNLRRYARVTFDAITENVIRATLKSPRQLNTNLVHAQEARRGADRLVGYQVSPALSNQTGIARLSAGRVQSVALRLVVDRQREIEAFKETKHFGAEAIFDNGKWRAQWDTAPFLKEGEEYILDAALAEQAAKCRLFAVTVAATKPATKAPPPPFTTATLLQAASVTLGYGHNHQPALNSLGPVVQHRCSARCRRDHSRARRASVRQNKDGANPMEVWQGLRHRASRRSLAVQGSLASCRELAASTHSQRW